MEAQAIKTDLYRMIDEIEDTNFLNTLLDIIRQKETTVSEWQQKEVLKRLSDYERNPSQAQDFEQVMDEIDKEL